MTNLETSAKAIADNYIELGGGRRAIFDDNQISVRDWEDEPAAADDYWKTNIEPLTGDRRRDVLSHLPDVNDDAK